MNERDKLRDWLGFYRASPPGYRANALIAVLESDGERMLQQVLLALGLVSASDVIKALREHQ